MGNDIYSLHLKLFQGLPDRERQVWSRPGPRSRNARQNQGSSTRKPSASGSRSQQRTREPSRHRSQRQPGRNVHDRTSQMPIYDDDYGSEDEEDPDYVTESVGSPGRRRDPVGAPSPPSRRPDRQTHPSHPRPPHPHLKSPLSSHPHPVSLLSRPNSPPLSHHRGSAAPHFQDRPHRHPQSRNPPSVPADIINIGSGPRGEGGGRYKGAAPERLTRNRERASSRHRGQELGGRRERESSGAASTHRRLSPRPGPRGGGNRRSRDSVGAPSSTSRSFDG